MLLLLHGMVQSVFSQAAYVRNGRNGKIFTTLSAAIADPMTLNGDVLFVKGVITEVGPVIVNKAVTIVGLTFLGGGEIRVTTPTAMNPAVLDVTTRPGRVAILNLRIRVPNAGFPVSGVLSNAVATMAGSPWPLAVNNCVIEQATPFGAGGIRGVAVFNEAVGGHVGIVGNTIRGQDFSPAAIVVDGFGGNIIVGVRSNRIEVLPGGNAFPGGTDLTANNLSGGILVSDVPLFSPGEGITNNVIVAGNRLFGDGLASGYGIAILDVPGAVVGGNTVTGFKAAAGFGLGIIIARVSNDSTPPATDDFYNQLNDACDGARVTGNSVTNNNVGIAVDVSLATGVGSEDVVANASAGSVAMPTLVQRNTIMSNVIGLDFGIVESTGAGRMTMPGYNLNAALNFWGVASGPSPIAAGCPGTGQMVRALGATECGTANNQVFVTPVSAFPPVL